MDVHLNRVCGLDYLIWCGLARTGAGVWILWKCGSVAWQQARGRRRCTAGRTVPLGGSADNARQLMLEHLGQLVLSGCAKCCAKS